MGVYMSHQQPKGRNFPFLATTSGRSFPFLATTIGRNFPFQTMVLLLSVPM